MDASYRSTAPVTRRASFLLYLGVALFLVLMALATLTVDNFLRATRSDSRAEAVLDLVKVDAPYRPSETPGARAWLDLEIEEYLEKKLESADPYQLRSSSTADQPLPDVLQPVLHALKQPVGETRPASDGALHPMDEARVWEELPERPAGMQFLSQRFFAWRPRAGGAERWLVRTRRKVLDDVPGPAAIASDAFVEWAAEYLAAVSDRLAPLPPSGSPRAHYVRIYALAEDGTFLTLPIREEDSDALDTVREEALAFRKRPFQPNILQNEFFFRFDFDLPARQSHYSGFYLDLGDHGLVTTLMIPAPVPENGLRAVAAIDLSFAIDWRDFARRHIRRPLVADVITLEAPPSPEGWMPWGTFRRAGAGRGVPDLERAVAVLADRERQNVKPGRNHVGALGSGTVGVFQVAQHTFLLVLFPARAPRFPWFAVVPLAALSLLLIGGFEANRRRAEAAQLKVERELAERNNLHNTLRVPLVVLDPNTDRVVYGNAAALGLGLEPRTIFGDLVDDRAGNEREHYERMQRASDPSRRAYGMPLRVRGSGGELERRWAVVRSMAVAAPIDSLRADERHRLAMLFMIEPDTDLALYAAELDRDVRTDERRRLAGLLGHGVNTHAQVLSSRQREAQDPFSRWLSEDLARRIAVAAWLLDHWHARAPLAGEVSVEPAQVRTTLARCQEIFALARRDAMLRARLHWANGILSGDPPGDEVIRVRIDWPERYLFTCPVKGGVGFFLGEVLVNAVRHGRPGSCPAFSAVLDPVRRELAFEVVNEVAEGPCRVAEDLSPYGGRRLLERMADLFGWRHLEFDAHGAQFRVSWSVPVSERGAPGESV